ncbi:MAG: signal peptidase II [Myxococcaceae bacterium]|nr:signal peptidase II [Myxococcaceae bacterium]MBH2006067.1 signal peptidase II [Myxococcaceae bacterium]
MGISLKARIFLLLSIVLVSVAADQVSKIWAQDTLAYEYQPGQFYGQHERVIVSNFFNLIYKENPAAAFSITSSIPDWFRKPFLLTVSILATFLFLIWYFRLKEADWLILSSFSMVIGGAIGNFLDRFRMGYVIDFLDVHAGFLGYPHAHWPTFNIADSCIVVGAIGILLHSYWVKKDA